MAVNRRAVVIGVVVVGGGLAGYEIYKYQKNKQAAAQAATASAAAASGYGYGIQSPYGYGTNAGITYGYGASGGFPAGYYGYGTPSPPGGTPPPVAATTNAQWDQAAITQLTQDGYDPATVSGALGAYLNGQQVGSAQVNIIDAAIGVEGYPPVAAPSGFPPAIKTGGTPGGGGGGGQGGGGGATVPTVVGERAEAAIAKLKAAGFKARTSPARNPARTYIVTGQNPAGGSQAAPGSTVTVNIAVHRF